MLKPKREILKSKLFWLIIVVVLLFLVPVMATSKYQIVTAISILLFTVFATCVYQVQRVNRLLFGAGAFIGIGAYTSATLVMNFGVPFWPAMILAGLVSALVALVIGIPILRVGGVYFAIITWSLGEVLITIYKATPWFGGVDGIRGISAPTILGKPFVGPVPYYYLVLGLMLVVMVVFYRLGNSRFGQDLRALGLSDVLASSLGINVPRYRLICFVIACFFLGLGGSFYAHYLTSIEPSFFGISLSSEVFAFSVIGGINSLWGGMVGSVIMTAIPEAMHAVEQARPLLYGLMVMIVILLIPDGIISIPSLIQARRRRLGQAKASRV